MSTLHNRVRCLTATTGTGTITIGQAVAGYCSFSEGGVANGATITYVIEDGNNYEIGRGIYTSATLTLTRAAIIASKIAGQAIDTTPLVLSGSAAVFITAAAEDLLTRTAALTDNAVVRGDGGAAGVQTSGVTIDDSNNVSGVVNLTQTGYHDLTEIAAPSNPAANVARLYPYDESSVTRLAYKDNAGATNKLASTAAATTDNAVSRFDGTTGLLQNSGIIIDDSNNVAGVVNLTQTGYHDLTEVSAPSNPTANVMRAYAVDSGGTTKMEAKDSSGTTHDLTHFTQAGAGATLRTQQAKLRDFVSVGDFGAVGDGVANDRDAFEAAATASTGVVLVPRGTYLIGSATSTRVAWLLHDATITGLSALGDGQTPTVTVDNTSRLAGTVYRLQDLQYGNALHIGDPDPWMEQFIRPSAQSRATMVVMSQDGQIGLTAATKTSDNPGTAGTQLAGVAGNFYAVNDYVGDRVGYAGYFEGWRRNDAGQTIGIEVDIVTEETTVPFNPGSPLSPSEAYTFGLLINSGGGRAGTHTLDSSSAALVVGANTAAFERGIVFAAGALDGSTSEAFSVPITYQMSWYAGTTKTSYLDQATHQRLVQDNAVSAVDSNKRHRASGAATQNLDVIFQDTSFGCSGSSVDYQAAFARVLQRSSFSGGNARFSYDIAVRNTDGTESQVTLNGSANKSFAPATDNDIALGDASFRWSTGYFSSLNTSGVITQNSIAHWTPVRKTADQSKSSTTTLANDTALQFAMLANTKYAIRARVHYGTPGGADIKFRHTGPASPTLVHIKRSSLAPGATAFGNVAVDGAYSSADIVITETSGTEGFFELEGIVHNGANAGTFAIQWAQNSSDAGSTIVWAGSYLEYAVT